MTISCLRGRPRVLVGVELADVEDLEGAGEGTADDEAFSWAGELADLGLICGKGDDTREDFISCLRGRPFTLFESEVVDPCSKGIRATDVNNTTIKFMSFIRIIYTCHDVGLRLVTMHPAFYSWLDRHLECMIKQDDKMQG